MLNGVLEDLVKVEARVRKMMYKGYERRERMVKKSENASPYGACGAICNTLE
jgi:hypothetical protein